MKSRILTVGGDKIAVFESKGDGPAALLIHGNSSSSRSFRKQLEGDLGREFRLVAMDLPGHGESEDASDPEGTYTIPGFARVVVEVARQCRVSDGVLVGWSLGGHIALEASQELPDLAGILIFGTPPLSYPPDMGVAFLPDPAMDILFNEELSEEEVRIRGAGWFKPNTDPESMPEDLLEDIRRSDGRFRTRFQSSFASPGFADEVEIVRNLKVPLAILHGAEERVINGMYISSLEMPTLWRGETQIIEDAGHIPQWEKQEAFNELLESFLKETS